MNKWAKKSRGEDEAALHRSLSFAFLPGLFFFQDFYLFVLLFGCAGFSLLLADFLKLRQAGATL